MKEPIQVFCCYARKDCKMLDELKKRLYPLERDKLIQVLSDKNIRLGKEWEKEIEEYLYTAQVILVLLSSNFMASDYCYSVEMGKAMERHQQGKARVIPLLLESVDLRNTPLGKLQALPSDAKPVVNWRRRSDGFAAIVRGIREVAEELRRESPGAIPLSPELLAVLNKHKEECQKLNISFDTPHLFLALFDIDHSRTLYHLNNLNPSYATKMRKKYEDYKEVQCRGAQKEPERKLLDFQWEERQDVRHAYQLALEDGFNEVTEEYLLLGIIERRNPGRTVKGLRKLLGEDNIKKLVENIDSCLSQSQIIVKRIETKDDMSIE